MDPLHPILPQPLNIPPVMPSTKAGRIDRDSRRDGKADQEEAQRRRERDRRRAQDDASDDDSRPHVDLTA
jgi:hypothetical protein